VDVDIFYDDARMFDRWFLNYELLNRSYHCYYKVYVIIIIIICIPGSSRWFSLRHNGFAVVLIVSRKDISKHPPNILCNLDTNGTMNQLP
jgi:hypothetical protein